jgi:hypothetical protein
VGSKDVAQFGGWPRLPRWVWVVAGVAAVAVLAWQMVAARTGPHHTAASSPTPATAPVPGARTPAAGPAPQWWPSPPSPCGPAGDLPLPNPSLEGTVRLWNPATGRPASAPIHASAEDGVTAVAFSPAGTLLASGGVDGTVRLWNPATGRPASAPMHVGSAYLGGVFGMAFSPDGTLLASASGDGTVRLWNLATRRPVGAPLRVGSGPDHRRLVAVFSPGGALIGSCWSASPTVAPP